MSYAPSPELLDLIDAVCDDQLTPEMLARLESILLDDADARHYFTNCLCAHALLERHDAAREDCHSEMAKQASGEVIQAGLRFFSRPTPFSVAVSLVVMATLLGTLAWVAAPIYRRSRPAAQEDATARSVARVSGLHNARWETSQAKQSMGGPLCDGQPIALQHGKIELTFGNGVVVVLAGPARGRLEGDNGFYLEAGQLAATVPPAGQGFQVRTAAATFVDLGTEFAVAVGADQAATLFVQRGQVSYQARGNPQPIHVTAGQGVEIKPHGAVAHTAARPISLTDVLSGVKRRNLLVNGGFEARDVPLDHPLPTDEVDVQIGWRSIGNESAMVHNSELGGTPRAGQRYVQFLGHPRPGAAIEQTFATTPGTQYQVTLFASRVGNATATPTLTVALFAVDDKTSEVKQLRQAEQLINWKPTQWRSLRYEFVAASDQTTLRLSEPASSNSVGAAPILDHVSVFVTTQWQENDAEDTERD